MKLINLTVILVLFLLSSCRMRTLNNQVDKIETADKTVISVKNRTSSAPLYFIIYKRSKDESKPVFSTISHNRTDITVYLYPGIYEVIAFNDTNNNYHFDKSELIAEVVYKKENSYFDSTKIDTIKLSLGSDSNSNIGNLNFTPSEPSVSDSHRITIGGVVPLSDSIFSYENGELGMWEPLTFYKKIGIGIYTTSKIDTNKIPVFFIHGIAGTPRDFTLISENLDTTKYQPYFFYYPSGFRLEIIKNSFITAVNKLYSKHKFTRVNIIAYSMGGLLSRFIINDAVKNVNNTNTLIDNLITISTPWGGHEVAALGIKYSPAIVPSWVDIVPNSPLVKGLFKTPLPEETKYWLFFGVKGENGKYTGNNDETVSISSELRWEAQNEATRIFGYNDTHSSIVNNIAVSNTINRIFNGEINE